MTTLMKVARIKKIDFGTDYTYKYIKMGSILDLNVARCPSCKKDMSYSKNPLYIQCPYCHKKFKPVPKTADMDFAQDATMRYYGGAILGSVMTKK